MAAAIGGLNAIVPGYWLTYFHQLMGARQAAGQLAVPIEGVGLAASALRANNMGVPAQVPIGEAPFPSRPYMLMNQIYYALEQGGGQHYMPYIGNLPVAIPWINPLSQAQASAVFVHQPQPSAQFNAAFPGLDMATYGNITRLAACIQVEGVSRLIMLTSTPNLELNQVTLGTVTSSLPRAFANFTMPGGVAAADHWQEIFTWAIDQRDNPAHAPPPAKTGLMNGLLAMQDMYTVSAYIIACACALSNTFPSMRAVFRIGIAVRRYNQRTDDPANPGMETGYYFYSIPYGQQPALVVHPSMPASVIAVRIVNSILAFLNSESQNYEEDKAYDSVIIHNIRMIAEPTGNLLPIPPHNINWFGNAPMNANPSQQAALLSQAQLRAAIRARFAHLSPRNAPELQYLFKIAPIVDRLGYCLLESLCLLEIASEELLASTLFPAKTERKRAAEKKLHQLKLHVRSRLDECSHDTAQAAVYQTGNVYDCLRLYMRTQTVTRILVVIVDKFHCKRFSVYQVDYRHDTDENREDADGMHLVAVLFDEAPMDAPVLAIYRAHAFVSTIRLLRGLLIGRGGVDERIWAIKAPDDYKPFQLSAKPCELPLAIASRGDSTPQGFKTVTGVFVLSYDFETGRCDQCTSPEDALAGTYVHHACCASVATSPSHAISFHGFECPRSHPANQGCVSQMLRWVLENYMGNGDADIRASLPTVIMIAFNGSRFDMHLVRNSLLSNHHLFNVVNNKLSQIMRIQWENIAFMDLYNIYPGQLGKVYETFSSAPQVRAIYQHCMPKLGKYACFPYALLSTTYYGKDLPLSTLREDWVWGNKRCDQNQEGGPDPTRSIGEVNYDWWLSNIANLRDDPTMFLSLMETQVYCEEDTLILQLCAESHHRFFASGVYNNRSYDATDAFTVGSLALKILRNCYAGDPKVIPVARGYPPELDTGLRLCVGSRSTVVPLRLLIKESEKGALTYNTRRFCSAPQGFQARAECTTRMESVGMTPEEIDDYLRFPMFKLDFNSSYPAVMRGELPIHPSCIERFPDGIAWSAGLMRATDLAVCSYDLRDSGFVGMTVNAGNCTSAPLTMPQAFYDPTDKEAHMNVIWGQEINQFAEWGAQIIVYAIVRFESAPILRPFIENFYAERLRTQGIDPVTLQSIPGAPKDEFMKGFYKLILNNIFGKLMQGRKALTQFCRDWMSFYQTTRGTVVDCTVYTVNGLYEVLAVDTVEVKPHVGDLSFIASFILSGGRLALLRGMHGFSKFTDMFGLPCEAICGDTDSMIIPRPLLTPNARSFLAQDIHVCRLGALKCEAYVTTVYSAAKKMYLTITEERDGTVSYAAASKGIPKNSLNEQVMQRLIFERETVSFTMPFTFEAGEHGLQELPTRTRNITAGNRARNWENAREENGFMSQPWLSLEEYLQHYYPELPLEPCSLQFV